MSILAKIFTLFRGTANEAGQAVVDKNAIRILDQELRDSTSELAKSKQELTKVMAQRQLAANRGSALLDKRREYEGYVQGALAKGDEGLAREVATKLSDVERDLQAEAENVQSLDSSIGSLKTAIRSTETQLTRLKQQIDTVKATEAVQRAQSAVSARHSGANSKIGTALDSLERIKQRQEEQGARFEAAHQLEQETGDGDLKSRLAQAGLVHDASNVDGILERFRKPQDAIVLDGPASADAQKLLAAESLFDKRK
ncbi:PspA/IM30 family protein [Luteimonas sp. MC1825]|uniref:PspA/IM30 family protein n=1 Tax=Luteimonas sp. MC1825 TaxID=2761107 RepID=UPI00160F323C|nr:PspA/IM30 family protein [Luteimonas sp. MC1825]MBB6600360.1 PspA/IM30 family protein [Luteimonas sp. MC1825]QOC88036.1 PspA/IM30 family protein [Luteimonas sp. MC1825]